MLSFIETFDWKPSKPTRKRFTAKGTAALLVPIANTMQQTSGTWDTVFIVAAGANILASLLAIAVLKPWRRKVIAAQSA
jgi:OFA family oxalate/formate antiporter-like MFS transporter